MTAILRDYAPLSLLVPLLLACVAGLIAGGRQAYRTRRRVQVWRDDAPPDPPEITYIEGPVDAGLTHQGD